MELSKNEFRVWIVGLCALLINFHYWFFIEVFFRFTEIPQSKVVDIAIISFFMILFYFFAWYYYFNLKGY